MEVWETPCKICPSCGGHGRIVCDCVPRNVPVDEMVGAVGCKDCHGDGDIQCTQCTGSGAVCRCTCDEIVDDSTCPAHYRENALQNQVLDLQAQNAQLLQSQDKIWGAADENLCAEYDAKIDDINEVLSDALEMVDIARQALQVIGSGHVFDSADDAEKWARDLANNALEEMSK